MRSDVAEGRAAAPAAQLAFAAIAGFVVLVNAVRAFRPAVLFDPDLS